MQKADLGEVDEDRNKSVRPMRADAVRNRARVLEAAESVFATEGIEVPVDVIAEKAGVGVGTLYRHFPTKEALCQAILTERVTALAEDARSRLDSDDPEAAFFGFLEHMVEQASLKRDLMNAMTGAGMDFEIIGTAAKQQLELGVRELLSMAQRAGVVRRDVTGDVVMSLVGATCMAATGNHPGVSTQEMLVIVRDGLRVVPPGR